MTAEALAPEVDLLEFVVDLEELLAADKAGRREVSGIAVPYNEDLERPDVFGRYDVQRFAPGSAVVRDNAQLFYGHDHLDRRTPIGRIVSAEHTDKGLKIRAAISDTDKGREVHTLLKDGVLDRFSIGHRSQTNHLEDVDVESKPTALVHDETDVFEVSVVPDPAYQSARVESVLERQPNTLTQQKEATMPDIDLATLASAEDVATLSTAVEDLTRQIATLGSTDHADTQTVPGRSYGEFIQMLAAGDESAVAFLQKIQDGEVLAYTGGTIADLDGWVKDSWVGDIYKLVVNRRRLHNLFSSSPLPATGMNVEYGKLLSDTTDVAEQAAEGDVLAFGKIAFDTATAPLKTYGGWGEMSRQQVERSAMAIVEKFFSALVNRYAKVTEAALRAIAVDPANAHTLAGAGTHDLSTADGWIDFTVDAALWLDDLGYAPEFVLVGYDVFKDLAKIRDGDNADAPRLLDRNSGTVNIVSLTGQLFNLPVVPVNSAGLVRIGHSEAIRTFESAGAPFRLQDDDITNLTKAFSIYGYEAIAVQQKDLLVAPDATA